MPQNSPYIDHQPWCSSTKWNGEVKNILWYLDRHTKFGGFYEHCKGTLRICYSKLSLVGLVTFSLVPLLIFSLSTSFFKGMIASSTVVEITNRYTLLESTECKQTIAQITNCKLFLCINLLIKNQIRLYSTNFGIDVKMADSLSSKIYLYHHNLLSISWKINKSNGHRAVCRLYCLL